MNEPHWRETFEKDGWALSAGILPPDVLECAQAEAEARYPSVEAVSSGAPEAQWVAGEEFAGILSWPTGLPAVDAIPFCREVVEMARALVGTDDIKLLRAGLQAKYAGAADYDQPLHFDYHEHCLVVPTDRPGDRLVGMFLYLSDVADGNGATRVVSTAHTRHLGADRRYVTREQAPGLYAAEVAAAGPRGTILAYGTRTYHRGATVRTGRRLTLAMAFAPAKPWYGFTSWPGAGENPAFVQAVARLAPCQRVLLGFPAHDDPYWTEETSRDVERRYQSY